MKRPSVQRVALVEPLTVVAALVSVLSFTVGHPDVPITDVIPGHGEPAMASHGRPLLSLDNIAPRRQLQATDSDLVLFTPAPAYRPANGVVISWWVGEGVESAEDAKLEVLDATGQVVREPAREGEERDRWSGPALRVEAGWNRFRWDVRPDPAPTFPGMILWGCERCVPVVPPGECRVRLKVGGVVASRDLEVRRNPWRGSMPRRGMD